MARPKKQLNRKEDIINAAQKLFAEKGFEKSTVNEIAKLTGISKGSVYLDFRNKDEIHLAVAKRHVRFLLDQLECEIKNAKAPYLDFLSQIFKRQILNVFDIAIFEKDTYATLIHTSYQIKLELKELMYEKLCMIASILEKAENSGEIRAFHDYKNIAHLIDISMQGFFPPYDLNYSPHHRPELSKEEVRSLLINDASIAIEIILSGLKTANYTKIEQ